MKEQTRSAIKLLEDLTERAKELTCFYAIEEALKDPDSEIGQVAERIIEAIPPGWQYPEICVVRVSLEGQVYQSENFRETPWKLDADIIQQDQVAKDVENHPNRYQFARADLSIEHPGVRIRESAQRIQRWRTLAVGDLTEQLGRLQ